MVSVVQIGFHRDPQGRPPARLMQDWLTLSLLAEAAASGGATVSVIQACAERKRLQRHGIDYHFLPCDTEPQELAALIAQLQPDVLHVHGLGFLREVPALAEMAPGRPIVLQDHANRPPRRPWQWPEWRRSLGAARGLMFCSLEQAEPFERRHLIRSGTRLYEVPECSSDFMPQDRALARRLTGLHGQPCLLWIGHLNPNKDPLTVLDALALAAPHLPGLQLWCCFGQAPLLEQVQERLQDPLLAGRVHLLGSVPHERIELMMAAADFLVQGSHREGSGYSVIEALACGLPPLVTAIPSFRALVGEGGALWDVGDAAQLAKQLIALAAEPPEQAAQRRLATRERFDAECSPAALGRRLCAVYEDVLRP